MPIKSSRLCGPAFAAWCMLSVSAAGAQSPMLPNEAPGPLVHEAFDAPYGRAVIAEFGKALHAAADPACLQSKGIGHDELTSRGRQLFVKLGTRIMETMPHVDMAKYTLRFPPSAVTELERLTKHPEVARYMTVERPLRLFMVAHTVAHMFHQYVIVNKFNVSMAPPFPNDVLPSQYEERIEKEMEALAEKGSAELRRFQELSRRDEEAVYDSVTRNEIYVGPGAALYDVGIDLAALCITAQR